MSNEKHGAPATAPKSIDALYQTALDALDTLKHDRWKEISHEAYQCVIAARNKLIDAWNIQDAAAAERSRSTSTTPP